MDAPLALVLGQLIPIMFGNIIGRLAPSIYPVKNNHRTLQLDFIPYETYTFRAFTLDNQQLSFDANQQAFLVLVDPIPHSPRSLGGLLGLFYDELWVFLPLWAVFFTPKAGIPGFTSKGAFWRTTENVV